MENGRAKSIAPRWWSGLWRTPMPAFGCEISDTGISVARWRGGSSGIDAAAWKPLQAGIIEASPLRENILKPDEAQRAFAEVLASLGIERPAPSARNLTEAVLVIPDQSARLFVLNFDTFPSRASERLPLVKWRLKKSLPFDVESAAISYFVQRTGTDLQVVAVAAPQWIVRQYEALAQQFGLLPKFVTLSTLASLGLVNDLNGNSAHPSAPGDWVPDQAGGGETRELSGAPGVLVAKYSPPWFTTAILQGGMLRLFRTVGLEQGENDSLSPADVLGSVYPSIAYFQDHFHATISRGLLCGLGDHSASIAEALERELKLRTGALVPDPGRLVSGIEGGIDGNQAERHFAALLGVVREQNNG